MIKKILFIVALFSFAISTFAQTRSGGCVQVVVGSDQKNGGNFDTVFSATSILDIDLGVVFTPGAAARFSDNHLVEFRVFTPTGSLYQSVVIPFTSDEGKRGHSVKIDGYPYPVDLRVLKAVTLKGQKQYEVLSRMPVAGTPIISSSLYGDWSAQAYVDGDPLPCAANATFRIQQ